MIVTERRFDVRLISPQPLVRYMKFRDINVRELAQMVGCSRATIGHLRAGTRTYCNAEWAARIEKVLVAPPGSLFAPEVSTVSREMGRRTA